MLLVAIDGYSGGTVVAQDRPDEDAGEAAVADEPLVAYDRSRLEPLGVEGEARVAHLEPGPDDVMREAPVAPKPAKAPEVLEPDVVGFDEELSVEVVGERARNSTVYSNADGTTTAVLSAQAVNYEDEAGVWHKIDPRLVRVPGEPGTFAMADNAWDARFSASGVDVVGEAGTSVGIRVDDEIDLPAPDVSEDGLSATYTEVWPGVDLRFMVDNESVRKELVLKHGDVPSRYSLTYEGIELTTDREGALQVVGEVDDVSIGQVEVFDRDGVPVSERARPTQTVTGVEASDRSALPGDVDGSRVSSTIELTVDSGWLASLEPDDFPVVIDPTLTFGAAANLRYAWTNNSSYYCNNTRTVRAPAWGTVWPRETPTGVRCSPTTIGRTSRHRRSDRSWCRPR